MKSMLLCFLLISPALAATAGPCDGHGQILLLHGKVLTVDASDHVAQALAIQGERIVAVGSDRQVLQLKCPGARLIDLGGRTVIPGRTDSHIHAIRGGQSFDFETHWNEAPTLKAALTSLADAAGRRPPEQWVIVGGGWHPEQFPEKRAPTSEELTQAVPDHPAIVQFQYDWAVLNAKAVEALGVNDATPRLPAGVSIERDAQGRATGLLRGGIGPFSVLLASLVKTDAAERKASLLAFLRGLARYGVTGVIDAAGGGSDASVYDPVFALWREHRLPIRVAYRVSAQSSGDEPAWFRQTLAYMAPGLGDDMLHFAGLGEIVVFGMNDGTRLTPGFVPTPDAEQRFQDIAGWAAERGYLLEIHAYTDDSANRILDVLERVATLHPLADLRWNITHISTGTPATIARMKALGLAYNVQQNLYFEAPQLRELVGEEAAALGAPTRLAFDAGLRVAGGTDATRVSPFNTMLAMQFQVDGQSVAAGVRRREDRGITRLQALRMYSLNSAWLARDDDKRGSIEVGKLADLAVLDHGLLDVPADQIGKIRSVLTLVGGRAVFADGPFRAMAPD